MGRVGFLRQSGKAFQTVRPDTEKQREPMDSFAEGTASLRQLCLYKISKNINIIKYQKINTRYNTDNVIKVKLRNAKYLAKLNKMASA